MYYIRTILLIIVLLIISNCNNKGEITKSDDEIPIWLDNYISDIENDQYYISTIIYRHLWRDNYYYHIEIPASSCAYCEVFNHLGIKVDWHLESFEDYINNRQNGIIIWSWKETH